MNIEMKMSVECTKLPFSHGFFLPDICATARPEHSKNTTSNDAAGKQYIYNKT